MIKALSLFKKSIKWSLGIAVITFVLAAIFEIVSTLILNEVAWMVGMVVVLGIVVFGVSFDIIGVSAAAVDEKPFHAMAAKRIAGSKQAMWIARNKDRFSNFCMDVIGDITGIVSGTAVTAVALKLFIGDHSTIQDLVSVLFTSIVAALTVGGRALGKSFGIRYATEVILQVGRLFYFVEEKLKIKLTYKKKRKTLKTKRQKK